MCRRAEIIPDFSIRENILMGAFARADGKRQIPELVPELFPYLMENAKGLAAVPPAASHHQPGPPGPLAPHPKSTLPARPTKGITPRMLAKPQPAIFVP